MTTWMIVGYVIGAITVYGISVGAMLARYQKKYPMLASSEYRSDFGFAVMWSIFPALIWPFGILLVACVTGFFQYGWSIKRQA